MTTMLERMAIVETKLDGIGTKVDELHTHFLTSKGRKTAQEEGRKSHLTVIGLFSAAIGGAAGFVTAVVALANRVAPVVDALPKCWRAPARACDDDDPFDEREPIVGQPNDNGDEPAK